MDKTSHYFDFTRTWLLSGVGLLACCAPGLSRGPVEYPSAGLGQYFFNTGIYLHAAVASECPEIAAEFHKRKQLEFNLPA